MEGRHGTGTEVVVRPSVDEDVDSVLRIYSHYVLNSACTFEETVPSLAEMHRRRQDVLASGLPFLVAEVNGVVCVRPPVARCPPCLPPFATLTPGENSCR